MSITFDVSYNFLLFWIVWCYLLFSHTHTHTRLTALFLGLPRWAGTRKVKPIWILLKQETVSGSGISWAMCKSAPRSRQITMPAAHHSVFYRPHALPAAQPTASKHWRHLFTIHHVATCTSYQIQAASTNEWLRHFRHATLYTTAFLVYPFLTTSTLFK